jgi:hypothetical protein
VNKTKKNLIAAFETLVRQTEKRPMTMNDLVRFREMRDQRYFGWDVIRSSPKYRPFVRNHYRWLCGPDAFLDILGHERSSEVTDRAFRIWTRAVDQIHDMIKLDSK